MRKTRVGWGDSAICTLLIHVEKFHSSTFKYFVSESLDFVIQPWKYENILGFFAPSLPHYMFIYSLISPPLPVAGMCEGFVGVVHVSYWSWIKVLRLNEERRTVVSARRPSNEAEVVLDRWTVTCCRGRVTSFLSCLTHTHSEPGPEWKVFSARSGIYIFSFFIFNKVKEQMLHVHETFLILIGDFFKLCKKKKKFGSFSNRCENLKKNNLKIFTMKNWWMKKITHPKYLYMNLNFKAFLFCFVF